MTIVIPSFAWDTSKGPDRAVEAICSDKEPSHKCLIVREGDVRPRGKIEGVWCRGSYRRAK
jgi:hypothetical protein